MKKKLLTRKNKDKLLSVVFSLLFISFFSLNYFFVSKSNYNRKEQISYNISNDTYEFDGSSMYNYIKITRRIKNGSLYNDLLNNFHYNFRVKDVRQYVDDDTLQIIDDDINIPVRLYTQNTFSISDSELHEGGYYIDNGLFSAYFNNKDLGGKRDYISSRFGCDGFIFISDTLANKICTENNMPICRESYLQIINNEKLGVLNVKNDDTSFTLSINNIIYSDKRTAKRCSFFNENFGLFSKRDNFHLDDVAFEVDMREYSYNVKSFLDELENFNYSVDDYDFEFYNFEKESLKYVKNDGLSEIYKDYLMEKNNLDFYYIFSIIIILVNLVTLFLAWAICKLKEISIDFYFLFQILFTFIFSLLYPFVYLNALVAVLPTVNVIFVLIVKGGTYFGKIKNRIQCFTKTKGYDFQQIKI